MPTTTDAAVDFAPYFRGSAAAADGDPSMLDQAYELRYQVYCLECGFLDASAYADGRESDPHDDDAMHFFAHNLRQELVGYVRLVPADVDARFPWQAYCRTNAGVVLPPPGLAAEVSRLMVRRDYRRRRGDLLSGLTACDDEQPGVSAESGERRSRSPQLGPRRS